MEQLPQFRYHPDPLRTGSVCASEKECRCCGGRRGYIYTGPVYAQDELGEAFCPWCIAAGDAAARFDAMFSDDYSLVQAGVGSDIVTEVTRRTPGFSGWQQEAWLVHCGDACAFHGDAEVEDLLTGDARTQLAGTDGIPQARWAQFIETYRPGGNPSVYRYECVICGAPRFQLDFT
jgi:uncharacterized protein CbrC (UPF0167 family)